MSWHTSETDIAKPVIPWLEDQGFEVYQEVKIISGVADVVGVVSNRRLIIETKRQLSLQLIEQAYERTLSAHWVSIAVPQRARTKNGYPKALTSPFLAKILDQYGIGLIEITDPAAVPGYMIDKFGKDSPEILKGCVREMLPPRLNRKAFVAWEVFEEQKTQCLAGSRGGGYYTPFSATAERVQKYIKHHPGCCLKDIIEGVDTHYRRPSTAKSCLSKYLQSGVIKGIRCDRAGKFLRFFAEGNENEI